MRINSNVARKRRLFVPNLIMVGVFSTALIGQASMTGAAIAHGNPASNASPKNVATQFKWLTSPVLETAERWSSPIALVSERGEVGAVWQQRLTEDQADLVVAELTQGQWSNPIRIAAVHPCVADVRSWPHSSIFTLTWLEGSSGTSGSSSCEAAEEGDAVTHIVVVRRSSNGVWDSVRIPLGTTTTSMRWQRDSRLEVRTLPSGETRGVAQASAESPVVFTWSPAGSSSGVTYEFAPGWTPAQRGSAQVTEFAISQDGRVFAFVDSISGLEVRRLENKRWAPLAVVQEASEFIPVEADSQGGQLQLGVDPTNAVVAWQQMDARYREDYQVWSATVSEDGTVKKSLMKELARPSWVNNQPRIEMDVSDTGRRCLTYVSDNYSTLEGVTGTSTGWLAPVPSVGIRTRLSVIGQLVANDLGCLGSGLWEWFDQKSAAPLPRRPWFIPQGPAYVSAANQVLAVGLLASGTNQMQINTLARIEPPVIQVPGAVASLSGLPQVGGVLFSWSPPQDKGGALGLAYQWRKVGGPWVRTTRLGVLVQGKKGRALTIEVRAVNTAGPGPARKVSAKPR